MSTKIYSNSALNTPNEILAIIINELAPDPEDNDKTLATLASCRLASHVLCSLATPLFFSSIQLTDMLTPGHVDYYNLLRQRATRFNQILANRNIATSVHILTLCCGQKSLDSNDTLMSAILHHLPNIRTFALEIHSGEGYFCFFPEGFASAIRTLCKSPNLTALYLDNVRSFPFMAITACPNLRCLHLRDIAEVNYFFFGTFRNNSFIPVRPCKFERRDIKPAAPALISGLLGY